MEMAAGYLVHLSIFINNLVNPPSFIADNQKMTYFCFTKSEYKQLK